MFKTKTKRLFFSSLLFLLLLSFIPAFAAPLVNCGNTADDPCTWADLEAMANSVIDFVLFKIVPPLAVITLIIAAINLMTSAGNAAKLTQAKQTIIWIIAGLIVVYGAWAIVSGFITAIGGGGDALKFFR
ncbi:MAG: TrbC/VirB2 family protein [Candidatus Paceibacterota bacterium]|jgi:type IV secretory pathway VirB2 component (pilin)